MTRNLMAAGLLLTVLAAAPGCKKDEMVKATVTEVDTLADELVATVKNAEDKKQGVQQAQALLDARKAELGQKMTEIGGLRGFQVSEETAQDMKTSLSESNLRVVNLKLSLMMETANDKELGEAVNKLVDDFSDTVLTN